VARRRGNTSMPDFVADVFLMLWKYRGSQKTSTKKPAPNMVEKQTAAVTVRWDRMRGGSVTLSPSLICVAMDREMRKTKKTKRKMIRPFFQL
jgi:hypothetical protein